MNEPYRPNATTTQYGAFFALFMQASPVIAAVGFFAFGDPPILARIPLMFFVWWLTGLAAVFVGDYVFQHNSWVEFKQLLLLMDTTPISATLVRRDLSARCWRAVTDHEFTSITENALKQNMITWRLHHATNEMILRKKHASIWR